ncbi:MAG: hypothetical protein ACFCU1_04860 [Sumerlaeia bacterium]
MNAIYTTKASSRRRFAYASGNRLINAGTACVVSVEVKPGEFTSGKVWVDGLVICDEFIWVMGHEMGQKT